MGLDRSSDRLVIAPDETFCVALVVPYAEETTVTALALEDEVGDRRVFEARLGSENRKLDLEWVTMLEGDRVGRDVALGSGSWLGPERTVSARTDGSKRFVLV